MVDRSYVEVFQKKAQEIDSKRMGVAIRMRGSCNEQDLFAFQAEMKVFDMLYDEAVNKSLQVRYLYYVLPRYEGRKKKEEFKDKQRDFIGRKVREWLDVLAKNALDYKKMNEEDVVNLRAALCYCCLSCFKNQLFYVTSQEIIKATGGRDYSDLVKVFNRKEKSGIFKNEVYWQCKTCLTKHIDNATSK